MNKILELREKRAKAWEAAKAFLDSKRGNDGLLSAEDTTTYEKMEADVVALGKEIDRLERQQALDLELSKPTSTPIKNTPALTLETKTGKASDDYKHSFWNAMRIKAPSFEITNALQIGTDSEGGYLVPDEYDKTLVAALLDQNVFRSLATIIQTASGERKIPIVSTRGSASFVDEEGPISESDDSFSQISLSAYKLATMLKISEELLNDSMFNLEAYIANEFARRIAVREEEAFFVGDGVGKPTGIFNATGGADIGVTTASSTAITFDEVLDLYHSLRVPYRKNATFVMNDATAKAIRKLKDGDGNYMWQSDLKGGAPNMILGCPVVISPFVPTIASNTKVIAFGDFSYYWIADRQGRAFKRLNEIYATTGQIGFLASERIDGKLVLPEAIKVLKMK